MKVILEERDKRKSAFYTVCSTRKQWYSGRKERNFTFFPFSYISPFTVIRIPTFVLRKFFSKNRLSLVKLLVKVVKSEEEENE